MLQKYETTLIQHVLLEIFYKVKMNLSAPSGGQTVSTWPQTYCLPSLISWNISSHLWWTNINSHQTSQQNYLKKLSLNVHSAFDTKTQTQQSDWFSVFVLYVSVWVTTVLSGVSVEGHDWCIIQLGVPGLIYGFDVDTSFFTGNHSPYVSIQAGCLGTDLHSSSSTLVSKWFPDTGRTDTKTWCLLV